MSIRMRHTRSHTRNRRSHHALTLPRLSKCIKCSTLHIRHRVCNTCGSYKGRDVVDVMKKITKREEKRALRTADTQVEKKEKATG